MRIASLTSFLFFVSFITIASGKVNYLDVSNGDSKPKSRSIQCVIEVEIPVAS